ncbi:diphosphomevalonate decarboxylase, partial [Candidatus Peregrinibacteria bacterium CG10_big_fil_rev_8_21_14_0_10_54_7]
GLASSSAVFSCLARAIQGLILPTIELTDEQTSVMARLGSGSAARSIFGGFSALLAGEGDAMDSAYGKQYA